MTDNTQKTIESIEIYPNIVVYKNVFKDISKTYALLKESAENNDDRVLNKWSQWSRFGEYISPQFLEDFPYDISYETVRDNIKCTTQTQQDQKDFMLELLKGFYDVTEDYAKNHGVNIDKIATTTNEEGQQIPLWKMSGPSIAKYRADIVDPVAMSYHSDYIWEPRTSPGYKFAITALAYFNDDYEGGEIDFYVNKELYKYKPEAGDYLVFPSGHPEILTKDGQVYLHGVLPPVGPNKYLSRMYWTRYSQGDADWYAKEKEFGKDVWLDMQPEIMEQFRLDHPNKNEVLDGVRIK